LSATTGVPIAVRHFGADDAHLTVVFVHGHCLRAESWSSCAIHLLRRMGGVGGRGQVSVAGRGRSSMTIAAWRNRGLARSLDLHHRQLEQRSADAVPARGGADRRRSVLVGHSIGVRWSTLAYARLFPAAIGARSSGSPDRGRGNGITELARPVS